METTLQVLTTRRGRREAHRQWPAEDQDPLAGVKTSNILFASAGNGRIQQH